jgi:hypothetical protein
MSIDMSIRNADDIFAERFYMVEALCKHPGFYELLLQYRWLVPSHEETSILFMRDISRFDPFAGYVPTVEDLIQARRKTTGIAEAKVNVTGKKFILVDLGGARSERKKVFDKSNN